MDSLLILSALWGNNFYPHFPDSGHWGWERTLRPDVTTWEKQQETSTEYLLPTDGAVSFYEVNKSQHKYLFLALPLYLSDLMTLLRRCMMSRCSSENQKWLWPFSAQHWTTLAWMISASCGWSFFTSQATGKWITVHCWSPLNLRV